MIRTVVVGRLHPGADRNVLDRALRAVVARAPPGLLAEHHRIRAELSAPVCSGTARVQ